MLSLLFIDTAVAIFKEKLDSNVLLSYEKMTVSVKNGT